MNAASKVLTFCALVLLPLSCKKESASTEDLILGKWTLTEKTVDQVPVILSDCEKLNTIEFRLNNFCLLYDGCAADSVNSGWDYKYGMLNISKQLPAAYYIEQLDGTSLKIRRNDIAAEGNLQVTVLSWLKKLD
jgi:hypothetical protein